MRKRLRGMNNKQNKFSLACSCYNCIAIRQLTKQQRVYIVTAWMQFKSCKALALEFSEIFISQRELYSTKFPFDTMAGNIIRKASVKKKFFSKGILFWNKIISLSLSLSIPMVFYTLNKCLFLYVDHRNWHMNHERVSFSVQSWSYPS